MEVYMAYNIKDIQETLSKDQLQWSGHILKRMQQRGIKVKDILNCLSTGEIIEYYEDDYPYPSCLILGHTEHNKSIHVVCSLDGDNIWMITAYYPSESEWLADLRTRRR